jgi:hypothetical protein
VIHGSRSNSRQHPKVEEFGDDIFFALAMQIFDMESKALSHDFLNLILGRAFVLLFQKA